MIRDMGICRCCGMKGSEVHHIKPIVYGGKDEPENMVVLCSVCHTHSPDEPEEFYKYMNQGGARYQMILGKAVRDLEDNNLELSKWLPRTKKIIQYFIDLDYKWALETYNLKEVQSIKDIPLSSHKFNKRYGSTIAPRSNSPTASAKAEDLIAGKEQSDDCPNLSDDKLSLPADIRRNSDTPLKSMEQLK